MEARPIDGLARTTAVTLGVVQEGEDYFNSPTHLEDLYTSLKKAQAVIRIAALDLGIREGLAPRPGGPAGGQSARPERLPGRRDVRGHRA